MHLLCKLFLTPFLSQIFVFLGVQEIIVDLSLHSDCEYVYLYEI